MNKKFTVNVAIKELRRLCLGCIVFFVFGILWTIFKDGKNPVLITCIFSTVLIPLILYYLYISLVYVTVSGNTIVFRNMFGITHTADIKEITKVVWKTGETQYGKTERIIVYIGSKKFSVETLMKNSDKFFDYISSNVSEDIIVREVKNIAKNK